MRVLVAYLALLAVAVTGISPQSVQSITNYVTHASGGLVVTSGWTYLLGTSASTTANSGPFWIGNGCTSTLTNFCTMPLPTTTAGSVAVYGLVVGNGSDTTTITSAFTCTALTAGKCDGIHSNVDTATCPGFAHSSTNDRQDACYVVNGAGGATFVTENWSGTPLGTGTGTYMETVQLLPPLCNGVRCTTSFDTNVYNFSNTTCGGGCTGSAMTLTGTDGIIGIYDSASGAPDNFVAPYVNDFIGNMYALDATSAPAYQLTGPAWYTLNQFAFKSQGGSYSPTAPLFTFVNNHTQDASVMLPGRAPTVACSPNCTLTLPNTTSTGHLGVLLGWNNGGAGTISSVTNGGTWVVPTGASTCKQTGITTAGLSCAYVLASVSGATTLSVTVSTNGNYQFAYFDVSRTGGSNVLDSQNSNFNSGALTVIPGQALTITGPDACFASWAFTQSSGLEIAQTYYAEPPDSNQWTEVGIFGAVGILLNVPSGGPTPSIYMQGSATTSASTGICFK